MRTRGIDPRVDGGVGIRRQNWREETPEVERGDDE